MNAYLTHLGIRTEIQNWLAPYYQTDASGNLCFAFGGDTEVYGLGFHRVPLNGGCWKAGVSQLIRQTVICSSAMEGIAWLNCHTVNLNHLLIVATGSKIVLPLLPKSKHILVFGNDLLGNICDLKAAAVLTGCPVTVAVNKDSVDIDFRYRQFSLPTETFSLNAFERLSGYRFHCKTSKPRRHNSWLNQLTHHESD